MSARIPATALLFVALALLSLAVAGPPPAVAANISVTTTDDELNADGDCSLREAVEAANQNTAVDACTAGSGVGADTIVIPAGTYTLDLTGADEDQNQTGDLDIIEDVTLDGAGASTILDGNNTDRVIELYPVIIVGTVNIRDMTVRNGDVTGNEGGGGLHAESGTVAVQNVTFEGNDAADLGGAILLGGDVQATLTSLTVTGNTAGGGGGVAKEDGDGSVVVSGGTYSGNSAEQGGGFFLGISSSTSLTGVAVEDNTATFTCQGGLGCGNGGGGIYIPATTVDIFDSTIENNHAPNASGGGILASGINLSGVDVIRNDARAAAGIHNIDSGSTIVDSTISGNSASLYAGGIEAFAGTISFTTISDNSAGTAGGGLYFTGAAILRNSAVFGNSATADGGGLWVSGSPATIENVTVSGNNASRGGGIFRAAPEANPVAVPQGSPAGPLSATAITVAQNSGTSAGNIFDDGPPGQFQVKQSIVAEPAVGSNCNTTLGSQGYNIEDSNTCGFTATGDQHSTDAMLTPLSSHGGPTLTHALEPGSPAIDAVTSGCPPPATDQRGGASGVRPQGLACDSGAYESAFTAGTPTPSPTPSPSPTASPAPVTRLWGDVDCDGALDTDDPMDILEAIAGLPLNIATGCYVTGQHLHIDGQPEKWGNILCEGEPEAVDALALFLVLAEVGYTPPQDCPHAQDEVQVTP